MKLCSLLVILLAILVSCERVHVYIPNDSPQNPAILSLVEPTSDFHPGIDITSFSVSFAPNEVLPELTVVFNLVNALAGEFFTTYIYQCFISRNDEVIQSFELQSQEILQSLHVNSIDVDFDGYLDMEICKVSGSTNWIHDYYRFNAEAGAFDETVFFSVNGRGVKFIADKKQAIVTINDGHLPCQQELFQYANGRYSHVRTEYIH